MSITSTEIKWYCANSFITLRCSHIWSQYVECARAAGIQTLNPPSAALYWTTVGAPSGDDVIVRGGDGDGVQWTYNCSFSMAVLSKSNVVTFCPLTTAMAPIAPVAACRYLFNQVDPLADSRLVEVNEKLGSVGRLDLSAVTRQT
jgi:hypothetical protein